MSPWGPQTLRQSRAKHPRRDVNKPGVVVGGLTWIWNTWRTQANSTVWMNPACTISINSSASGFWNKTLNLKFYLRPLKLGLDETRHKVEVSLRSRNHSPLISDQLRFCSRNSRVASSIGLTVAVAVTNLSPDRSTDQELRIKIHLFCGLVRFRELFSFYVFPHALQWRICADLERPHKKCAFQRSGVGWISFHFQYVRLPSRCHRD